MDYIAEDFIDWFKGVYRNRSVLITGHTGFKGAWLTFWLQQLGAKVVGYSKDIPSQPNHSELLTWSDDHFFYQKDVRDLPSILEVIERHRPEIIFHLAAQSLVRYSYQHPVENFSTNMMGTVNVLQAGLEAPSVKAVINVTSDKCYHNDESNHAFVETDRMGGDDPYSCSKGVSELITYSYRKSFYEPAGKLLASVRAGNVIGGGDWAQDRLIPDLVKATVAGKTTQIRCPEATRPWQHVLEPLSGYLCLGQQLLEGKKHFMGAWNFGPGADENLSVREVVESFRKYWPDMSYVIAPVTDFPEANLLRLDSSKAIQELGWSPAWDAAKAIAKTVQWYKKYYQQKKLNTYDDLIAYTSDCYRKKNKTTNANNIC